MARTDSGVSRGDLASDLADPDAAGVLAAIYSFKQFTIIWLLTGGGPAGATETIVIRVYNTAFRFYDFNYAAALGVAGFVMALTIALVFIMIQRHQEMEMA